MASASAASTLSSTTSTRMCARRARALGGCGAGGRRVGARTSGRRTVNVAALPRPSLSALTVPPCSSTRRCTSDRPMPRPPCARSSVRLTCVNMLEHLLEHRPAGCRRRCRARDTTRRRRLERQARSRPPPSGVYLAALLQQVARPPAPGATDRRSPTPARRRRRRAAWPRGSTSGWLPSSARLDDRAQVDALALQHRPCRWRCATRRAGRRSAGPAARAGAPSSSRTRAALRRASAGELAARAGRCGSARADCAARAPAWRGTRPCGGRPRAAPARPCSAHRAGRGSGTAGGARAARPAPRSPWSAWTPAGRARSRWSARPSARAAGEGACVRGSAAPPARPTIRGWLLERCQQHAPSSGSTSARVGQHARRPRRSSSSAGKRAQVLADDALRRRPCQQLARHLAVAPGRRGARARVRRRIQASVDIGLRCTPRASAGAAAAAPRPARRSARRAVASAARSGGCPCRRTTAGGSISSCAPLRFFSTEIAFFTLPACSNMRSMTTASAR